MKKFIDIADTNPHWRAVKASFALEGITLDEDDAVLAGRYLAGEITFEEGIVEILKIFNLMDKVSQR